jgi:ABC-type Fe3+-siderophore transport system permease subunit
MMLVAGYFRVRGSLPYPVWNYPLSFISFHTYVVQVRCPFYLCVCVCRCIFIIYMILLQGLLENEYVGTSFAVGQIRSIAGVQAVRGSYGISSSSNAKWVNLLVLLLMATGYRILLYVLLRFRHVRLVGSWRPSVHTASAK